MLASEGGLASLVDSLFPSALSTGRRIPQALTPVERLFPFVRTLRDYRASYLRRDLMAGLTTALFTIPQGMAYALIAGFPPAAGVTTSVVASILGAAFGSSEFLINGPTNAISVMLAGNAALFAANGDPVQAIVLLTLMIGAAQLLGGILRIGTLTRFVSEPVLTGFTAGAGVYIIVNQLPAALGIGRAQIVADLWGFTPTKGALMDLLRLARSLGAVHLSSLSLAVVTFVVVRALQRVERHIGRRLPATFIGVLVATLLAVLMGWTAARQRRSREDGARHRAADAQPALAAASTHRPGLAAQARRAGLCHRPDGCHRGHRHRQVAGR